MTRRCDPKDVINFYFRFGDPFRLQEITHCIDVNRMGCVQGAYFSRQRISMAQPAPWRGGFLHCGGLLEPAPFSVYPMARRTTSLRTDLMDHPWLCRESPHNFVLPSWTLHHFRTAKSEGNALVAPDTRWDP